MYDITEQDIRDSHQEPVDEFIQPFKDKFDNYIKEKLKQLICYDLYQVRQKNQNINIESYIRKKFEHVFSQLRYSFDFHQYLKYAISIGQLDKECPDYILKNYASYINELLSKTDILIKKPNQVINLQDEIGDVTQLDSSFNINFKCRTQAFLLINDKLYISLYKQNHIDLYKQYAKEQGIDYKDLDKTNLSIAGGHIVNSVAFIDWRQNVNVDDVKQKLIEYSKMKVYDYDHSNKTIKRLAKRG